MHKKYEKSLIAEDINNVSDEEVDCSDITALDDEFWTKATVTPPRNEMTVSLRLAPEVLEFFKSAETKGYTSKMVAVLQSYYEAYRIE